MDDTPVENEDHAHATRPDPPSQTVAPGVLSREGMPPRTMYHLSEEALQSLLSTTVRDALSRVMTTEGVSPLHPRRLFGAPNEERATTSQRETRAPPNPPGGSQEDPKGARKAASQGNSHARPTDARKPSDSPTPSTREVQHLHSS
ncbi:hypothetical protein Salat_2481900 [Sesamum alatum]|uniref:Uncharacterized protein n=1 Tax=Sesamum alatum TaxID=300844 RepID=A0AAE1XS39_9LAMI|nr:hypothetical protein Salat_2481900 [Sesamum alatum]